VVYGIFWSTNEPRAGGFSFIFEIAFSKIIKITKVPNKGAEFANPDWTNFYFELQRLRAMCCHACHVRASQLSSGTGPTVDGRLEARELALFGRG